MSEAEHSAPAESVLRTGRYACLFWVAAVSFLTLAGVSIVAGLVPNSAALFQEGGIVEATSVVIWGLGCLLSVWALLRAQSIEDRWTAVWFAMVSLLAGLRELDMETLLNPEVLGSFGIRYKLGWWIDGAVPFWVKLIWLVVFLTVTSILLYPLWATRREFVRNLVNRDSRLLILGAAICFLGLGFFFDDLMRGSTFVAFETRQMLEETCEWLGALWFLVVVLLHNLHVHRARTAQVPGYTSRQKPSEIGVV